MQCPAEISEVVLAIMEAGLLGIRASAWSGDAVRCAIEADHLHNLPGLIAEYSPEKLRFYWELERSSYRSQRADGELAAFEPLWEKLRPYAERFATSLSVG